MFGSSEMVVVLILVLVLFGGSQLPKLAKNLGKAQKEFKDAMAEADQPATPPAPPAAPVAAQQVDQAPQPPTTPAS
jgi:sec-independent protein translocase protein TatA